MSSFVSVQKVFLNTFQQKYFLALKCDKYKK